MPLFGMAQESQAAQPAGTPSGTTFNGYFAAVMAGASANFRLERIEIGVRAGTGAPTSQQMTVRFYRQTVAVVGTGWTLTAGTALDPRSAATAIGGLGITTAATAGTTGPTLGGLLGTLSFNTQQGLELTPADMEEWIVDQGTANGIAMVNIGNALPASHIYTVAGVWEE